MGGKRYRRILGVRFFDGTLEEALTLAKKGGLLVAPSGPGLAGLGKDAAYDEAVRSADIALCDSGFLALVWRIFQGEQLSRLSGLRFFEGLLDDADFRMCNSTFWVMPDKRELEVNVRFLEGRGIMVNEEQCYVAPRYGEGAVEDNELLHCLTTKKPRYIIVNIGGGVQEKLGFYLSRSLDYRPTIICTGAAIAFLTGMQAKIPVWVDRVYLGWLWRCFQDPKRFIPRYLKAFRLFWLLMKLK